MTGGIDAAGRGQVQGLGGADEARQEEAAAGLEAEAPAAEDEADLGVLAGDADVGGQRHGDADADRGAVDGDDDGLCAAVDGEADLAALVAVLVGRGAGRATAVEVHAGAEGVVLGVGRRKDDGPHAGVRGQEREGGDERRRHLPGEGITGRGPVELDDDDGSDGGGRGGMVRELEGWQGEGVVA